MNQEVMNLFNPVVPPQVFDRIQISIASPEKILSWSLRRNQKAGDDQLSDLQAGARWALLRPHLRSDQGLRVLVRQVQADEI